MTSSPPTLRLEKFRQIARLTIDNEARRNAMTLEMWEQLADLVVEAGDDPETRLIVLTGAGDRAFCAGADISQFAEKRQADGAAAYDIAVARAQSTLFAAAKPTIAIIHGACHGGGVGLALCCDLRLATSDAHFRIPAARLGLGYAFSNVELVVQRLGVSGAADLLFSSRKINAAEALRLGIVTNLFDDVDAKGSISEYVQMIAENAPLTLLAVKGALLELAKPEAERNRDRVDSLVAACIESRDYAEGQAAFREKRQPQFSGI
ncbi:enoyl-CoA hydratase/carnithine racemase [Rhodoligotrophos appendicifer]|uniref:enoyl-CoA hydratase n=1 Tax=Rhodoligotrophos appendicifer TaxID=987056 RepID=UPI00118569CF|nr:enoyl-CoA hydratase [Rhodoligotrophos appendicifer]